MYAGYPYAGYPYAGHPYSFGFGYPYAIAAAAPQTCGCPLRAGEANLQNIQWKLPELGGVKAIVKVNKKYIEQKLYLLLF